MYLGRRLLEPYGIPDDSTCVREHSEVHLGNHPVGSLLRASLQESRFHVLKKHANADIIPWSTCQES